MRASGGCHAFCFCEARRSVLTIAAACLTAFTLFQASPLAAQPAFPKPAGHVNDFAGVLDDASRKELEALLVTLETDTTAEVALATVSSLEGISVEEYATRMFNTWGVGQADKDNGVLILVAPSERQMRIEVGYGLEAVVPDGLAGSIIRNEFVPSFRDGNYQTGIVAGVRRVAAIVRRGEHVTESQLQALARAEEGARAIVVPSWIIIVVFALLVAGGGYMVGLGGGSKVISILVVGAIVAGLGLTLSWLYALWILGALWGLGVQVPVLAGAAWLGVKKSRSQHVKSRMRGRRTQQGGWIISGDTPTSGDSGSGSSSDSGDSFGGGSSGGGGASGSW